jgi:hypothetical protein
MPATDRFSCEIEILPTFEYPMMKLPAGRDPRSPLDAPTPKGTRPQDGARVVRPDHNEHGVAASTRYTPPIPKYVKESPRWVPILMFTLFILGALVILLYYLGAVPGGRSNYYLLVGLAFILGGLFTATKYH